MNEIYYFLIFELCQILALALFTWKSWLDYFRPDLFFIFNIYQNDFLNYKEHKFFIPFKGNEPKQTINKAEYDRTGFKPYINPKGIYTWNFQDNNQVPIQFTAENKIDGAGIIESRKKDYYKMMVKGEVSLSDYLPYIIIGLVVLVLIVVFYFMNQQSQTSQQQMQLLYNVTRSLQ